MESVLIEPSLKLRGNQHRDVRKVGGKDQLLIIIGHVDKAGNLHLQDGSKVAIKELQGPGQRLIIGCDTAKHLALAPEVTAITNGLVRPDEGLRLATYFFKKTVAEKKNYGEAFRALQGRSRIVFPIAGVMLLLSESELPE